MSHCYDCEGNPMALMDWARTFEDMDARRVAETTLPDGKYVSTVWLGLDHAFGRGPPLIFESMVFASATQGSEALDQDRYSTEAEAREGHEALVAKWPAAVRRRPGGREMAELKPRHGFEWSRVRWGGPRDPVAMSCSYCGAPFPEDHAPLRFF